MTASIHPCPRFRPPRSKIFEATPPVHLFLVLRKIVSFLRSRIADRLAFFFFALLFRRYCCRRFDQSETSLNSRTAGGTERQTEVLSIFIAAGYITNSSQFLQATLLSHILHGCMKLAELAFPVVFRLLLIFLSATAFTPSVPQYPGHPHQHQDQYQHQHSSPALHLVRYLLRYNSTTTTGTHMHAQSAFVPRHVQLERRLPSQLVGGGTRPPSSGGGVLPSFA